MFYHSPVTKLYNNAVCVFVLPEDGYRQIAETFNGVFYSYLVQFVCYKPVCINYSFIQVWNLVSHYKGKTCAGGI